MQGKLGKFDAFMILICGLMFADAIASNSSAGVPSITWWLILGLLYMIPSGFIIGELSGAFPGEGGIFVWISEGLGPKWAARTSWLFFCCGLFIPVSSFVMCSDILFTLFYPAAPFVARVAVALVFVWLMALVCMRPMSESKWVVNIAGLVKIAIFALALVAGIAYLAKGNAIANDISLATLTPTLDQSLMFLPIIVYCCTGMELASASAEQLDNPSKMLPKVIIGVAVTAVVLNVLANLGMLMVLPVDGIDLDLGILDLFLVGFGSSTFYYIAGIAFLFAVFAQCVTWLVGGNRGTAESAKEGELPAFLGKETKGHQPIGAIITTCAASTIMLILYAFMADTAADLFFSLLSCGVIGSLIPYVFMLIAYQRLKRRGAMDGYVGFKAPAGFALSWVCQIVQVVTLLLMIYIPGHGWNPDVITNVGGAAFMLITGELAIRYANAKAKLQDAAAPSPQLDEEAVEG